MCKSYNNTRVNVTEKHMFNNSRNYTYTKCTHTHTNFHELINNHQLSDWAPAMPITWNDDANNEDTVSNCALPPFPNGIKISSYSPPTKHYLIYFSNYAKPEFHFWKQLNIRFPIHFNSWLLLALENEKQAGNFVNANYAYSSCKIAVA